MSNDYSPGAGSFRHIDELLSRLSHEQIVGAGMLEPDSGRTEPPKKRRKGQSHAFFMLNQGLFERSQRS